jgi:hypothetical protein
MLWWMACSSQSCRPCRYDLLYSKVTFDLFLCVQDELQFYVDEIGEAAEEWLVAETGHGAIRYVNHGTYLPPSVAQRVLEANQLTASVFKQNVETQV